MGRAGIGTEGRESVIGNWESGFDQASAALGGRCPRRIGAPAIENTNPDSRFFETLRNPPKTLEKFDVARGHVDLRHRLVWRLFPLAAHFLDPARDGVQGVEQLGVAQAAAAMEQLLQ